MTIPGDCTRWAKWLSCLVFAALSVFTLCADPLRSDSRSRNPQDSKTTIEASKPEATPVVSSLLDEAERLGENKKYREALVLADRALSTAQAAHDVAGEGWAEVDRAGWLTSQGRSEEAIAAWGKAAKDWVRLDYGPGQINALCEAALAGAKSHPDALKPLFMQAFVSARAEKKRPKAALATLYSFIATLYEKKLEDIARETISVIAELLPQGQAGDYFDLGIVAEEHSDYLTAIPLLKRALTLAQNVDPNSEGTANCLIELGRATRPNHRIVGDNYFKSAVQILRKLNPRPFVLAEALAVLGNSALDEEDLTVAKSYFLEELDVEREHKQEVDNIDIAQTYCALGQVAMLEGNLSVAREYLQVAEETVQLAAPTPQQLTTVLNSRGNVEMLMNHYADAEKYFSRSLDIIKTIAPRSELLAEYHVNMGVLEDDIGKLDAAKQHFNAAITILREISPNSLSLIKALANRADVYREQKDWSNAKKEYVEALGIRKDQLSDELRASLHGRLALLAEDTGDLNVAEREMTQAFEISRSQFVGASEELREASTHTRSQYAVALASYQLRTGRPMQALLTVEDARATALLRMLAERQENLRTMSGDQWVEYATDLSDMHNAAEEVTKAESAQSTAEGVLRVAKMVGAPTAERATLEKALKAQTDALDTARSNYLYFHRQAEKSSENFQRRAGNVFEGSPDLKGAIKALDPGTVFVLYAIRDFHAYVFLVSGGVDENVIAHELGSQGQTGGEKKTDLVSSIRDFQHLVSHRESDSEEVVTAGRRLFLQLFPPMIREKVLAAKRLVISPDGILWGLPFAALVTNANGKSEYLGARVPISYSESLALFHQTKSPRRPLTPGQKPVALVVGAPCFNCRMAVNNALSGYHGEWAGLFDRDHPPAALQRTEDQAKRIAQLYGAEPLMHEQATEGAVREKIEEADVIHLATHGYLHPNLAMASALLLAAPKTEPSPEDTSTDGALQAWEIFSQLKLRADLVVLSACETALGKNVSGEGIVGLVRAFEYAGARSIVASQWRVEEESTTNLMIEFHTNLRAGMAKDVALAKAMDAVRSDLSTASPYFWAGFGLWGNQDNSNLWPPAKEKGETGHSN